MHRSVFIVTFISSFVAACHGPGDVNTPAPESPATPEAADAPEPSHGDSWGAVRFSFNDGPNIRLPITVRHPDGEVVVDQDTFELPLPSGGDDLTLLYVGDDKVWVHVPAGGIAKLYEHPCCRVGFNGNAYDDSLAMCGESKCPDGSVSVPHELADDPVCGERMRCVVPPQVRVVHADGAEPSVLHHEQTPTYTSAPLGEAKYTRAYLNIAEMFVLEGGRERIAMDHETRYTIWVEAGRITRVTRDGPM